MTLHSMTLSVDTLRQQLLQLQSLHATGTLSDAAYAEARAGLEQRLVQAVLQDPSPVPAPAPAAGKPRLALPRLQRTPVLLALGVLVLAAAGYALRGSPALWNAGPAAVAAAPAAGAPGAPGTAPHPTAPDQIAAMVDQLAQRLKERPDDAEGWVMLARSYAVMGRHADARPAYARAIELRPSDAALMADYADTLAMVQGGRIDGESLRWVRAALKADPDNLKALSLAATEALDRQDTATAIARWERVVALAPADSGYLPSARDGLAEARRRAGLPPSATGTPAATPPVTASAPSSQAAAVSGTVDLAPALKDRARPDDTVFIVARSTDPAQRMPLAIQRRQVRDLPIRFTLDDSAAMSPAAALSGATRVLVSARISRSGDAMTRSGDITAAPVETPVGRSGLVLELREIAP